MGLMSMGSRTSQFIVWILAWISLSPFAQGQGMDEYNPVSLDAVLHDYAFDAIAKPHTDVVYNVSLPSNFSGIAVSVVRHRSSSFWREGFNFCSFHIPPRIVTIPFVRRLAIVYQNLGNWSSYYYNVPNYTLVSPVVGFLLYNATQSPLGNDNASLQLRIEGDPVSIHFPRISNPSNAPMKCVRFGANGSFEFTNMTVPNVCMVRGQGHFSVVVPSPPPPPPPPLEKKARSLRWWAVGIAGLVVVVLAGVVAYKLFRRNRIRKMERQSQRSETLTMTWVGTSRMPSATWIRTQPVIENDYVP